MGMRRRVVINNDDFVFISCLDTIFRTKSICQIAGNLDYSIIYLPNFHIISAIKYHRFFYKTNAKVFFPTLKVRDIFSARRKLLRFNKKVDYSGNRGINLRVLQNVLAINAIYDEVVKRYLNDVGQATAKWLLEHEKYYFMPCVNNLHRQGIQCTMLQHGIFFKPSFNYIPLFCDKVLCCSEREKHIYMDNGVAENRIEIFGAPLQTLQFSDNTCRKRKHYDLLVMMTYVGESNVCVIRKVLLHIKANYQSVLVRMRPRSRKIDLGYLTNELRGMAISAPGVPIDDDILCCDKVVTFSEDANVEIAKYNKPFVFIWTEGVRDTSMGRCATENNFTEEIAKLMTREFYSTFSKEQYKVVLGETDLAVLRNRFEEYIKS